MKLPDPFIVTLIAPPGGGKGTQSDNLCEIFGIPHLSTGAMIRAKEGHTDEVGLALAESARNNRFAPDDIMIKMIRERTSKEDCEIGYVLDGFPRTLEQANKLEGILVERGHDIIAIELLVTEDCLAERVLGREICGNCEAIYHKKTKPSLKENICDICGSGLKTRPEDTLEALQKRLQDYYEKTAPILNFYRQNGRLMTVNGTLGPKQVTQEICALFI